MGYKFSLVLSREITDEESTILREAGCAAAVFGTDSLPTNAEVTVTSMDFDDTSSPTLAEAIESALEAVKAVPDLSVPGLTVPAQPAGPVDEGSKVVAGEVVEEEAAESAEEISAEEISAAASETVPATSAEEQPIAKKAAPRKRTARKPATRKTVEASVSD